MLLPTGSNAMPEKNGKPQATAPEPTPFEKFDQTMRKLVRVSKVELDKAEEDYQKARRRKKRRKPG
jgi:hypothetical protein